MPLDDLGCTRATLTRSMSLLMNACRDGDRLLQLLIFNEEFLVSASHQLALITSLPFVHTARRSYRLSNPVNTSDRDFTRFRVLFWKVEWTLLLRGRRSRNKVSVGEPAEGSFTRIFLTPAPYCELGSWWAIIFWQARGRGRFKALHLNWTATIC